MYVLLLATKLLALYNQSEFWVLWYIIIVLWRDWIALFIVKVIAKDQN